MKKLWAFHVYYGRSGDLDGRFLTRTEAEEEKLRSLYGKRIHFGEVLGKHSDVAVHLEPEHVTLVTDDQAFLDMADHLKVDLRVGFDPLQQALANEEEGLL